MSNKLYGLIGSPLSHSFSGKYFESKFEKEQLMNCDFKLYELEDLKNFKTFISEQPGLKGLSVTIPYKKQVINYLDYLDMDALKIGAVNCIKVDRKDDNLFLSGYNTDIFGFEESIKPLLKPHHKKAIILGTGGAAQAVAFVFDKLGIEYIFVSRSPSACKEIRYKILHKDIIREHLIIVNTTPVGMNPNTDKLPEIPYEWLTNDHLLYDLIYNPELALFLKKGQEMGSAIKNGLEMLHLQAEKSWEIWNQKSKLKY